MNDLETLLRLNLETIQGLEDGLLAELGELATRDLAALRVVSNTLDGEALRRMSARGPDVKRLMTPGVLVERKSTPDYKWDADGAMGVLCEVATPEEMERAFKVKPPAPSKEVVTVNTQSALALAKNAGLEKELAAFYEKRDGPPTVRYTALGHEPVTKGSALDDARRAITAPEVDPMEMEFE